MHCSLTTRKTAEDILQLDLQGEWRLAAARPDMAEVEPELAGLPEGGRLTFVAAELTAWDSSLLAFLTKLRAASQARGLVFDGHGLPEGAQRLLELAASVPERSDTHKKPRRESFLARVGDEAIDFGRSTRDILNFIGEASLAMLRMLRGRSRLRLTDLGPIIQECGADALPIVSLISLLVGLILAYVGAVQLVLFGAEIYVASLVGIAMVRVMGAVMAGVIMAGRTGAAFAAQLGTMQVNEEIDALTTIGISPMEFLVLPRMLALSLMMPLLCLYADLLGIIGGLIVGVGVLDLNVVEYVRQTTESVSVSDLWIGVFQGFIFGVLVAVAGCLRGLQCGRSASAVGQAATSAVVTGIISITVATAIVTIICNVLGI